MTKKFGGKYRIDTARAKWWNYANDGAYFVTICTQNREHFFGEISGDKMVLNDVGEIVAKEWKRTFNMRPDMNLWMDEFVVMPNHFHGILVVRNDCRDVLPNCRDVLPKRLYSGVHKKMSEISPTKHSISTAIRFFKRQTTIRAKKINPQFAWQTRFHDHIIRTEKSLENIRNYVQQNPALWHRDRNNNSGLWM